jgi:Putative stress-induced transcription regulator/CGNR zinc finger
MVTYRGIGGITIVDAEQQADHLVRLAVDLVNLPGDGLDAAGLARFLVEHGEAPPIELDAGDVRGLVQVREQLREVFAAADVDLAAALVNRLLDRAQAPPRLSNHDGTAWHLHVTGEQASWADWLAAITGLGLARLIAEDGIARIGRCAAPGCGAAFAGGPRNHLRRYCSATCANRARVAAFRARRA